jgi:hypothetical protein
MIISSSPKMKKPTLSSGSFALFVSYADATRPDSGAKPEPKSKRAVAAVLHEATV